MQLEEIDSTTGSTNIDIESAGTLILTHHLVKSAGALILARHLIESAGVLIHDHDHIDMIDIIDIK